MTSAFNVVNITVVFQPTPIKKLIKRETFLYDIDMQCSGVLFWISGAGDSRLQEARL